MSTTIIASIEALTKKVERQDKIIVELLADMDERNGIRKDGSSLPKPEDRMAEYFEQAEQIKYSVLKVEREMVKLEARNAEQQEIRQREVDRLKDYVDELRQWRLEQM